MPFRVIRRLTLLCLTVGFFEYASGNEGVDYLNALRKHSGLNTLHSDNLLDKAAASHANYLLVQQSIGHFEQSGHNGFTGKTPSDRVVFHGYASKDVMENVSINAKNQKDSIDKLFAAIYHRFVFLSLDKDLIGSSTTSTRQNKRIKNVSVYDLGSSSLRKLCQEKFVPANGVEYMQYVCREQEKLVPRWLYEQKKEELKTANAKVVFHPYEGQNNVPPVFYEESPDPLPDYGVSGYPISVQFNEAYFHQVNIRSFRLYDKEGKELKNTRLLSHKNDPNKRLKRGEYALMPLERLEYATNYTAKLEADTGGKNYAKTWSFSTLRPEEKLYRISGKNTRLETVSGSTILLYFVPNSPRDVLKRYKASKDLKIEFFDQNTLKVRVPQKVSQHTFIEAGGRRVTF